MSSSGSGIDLQEAKRVLTIEAKAINDLANRLDNSFTKAIELILKCKGRVVLTGMGKSGIIARKIASTMSSTGTPAMFVHPAESSHGDLGMISSGDVIMALSYSGETAELASVLRYAVRKGISVIGMTGNTKSQLAQASEVVLDVSVSEEACPLKLAPTASTTVSLAMGDALAMTLLKAKGFKPEEFAEYHPHGSLGAKLLTQVKDVMHSGESLPMVAEDEDMKSVINKMTLKEVRGVAAVVDPAGSLVGSITDGDLRRRLDQSKNPLQERAADIMSKNPKTIDKNELAERALRLMEEKSIQSLFVVDASSGSPKKPVGLLHLQDILKAKVR